MVNAGLSEVSCCHIDIDANVLAWRREDMQAYMYRLYLEYARLMSTDRDNGKMVSNGRLPLD